MSSLLEMNKLLIQAVERGDIQLVTRFLDLGVDINRRDNSWPGDTLLIKACWKNQKEMVEFLLTKSADVNGTDRIGWTSLMWAAVKGFVDIVNILLKTKDINVMKKTDFDGWTAIHLAAANNHVTIVERLLSCSVPVDINDNDGCTPLWCAAYRGRVCCVDVLLKHGASPQHESKMEGSPLKIAKRKGRSDVVEMMEEAIRLRSHPYIEGHVSVMRHQYEEKIAELQSEVEQMKEELRQSSLVHESERTRLSNNIQQKEEEMRCLVSTLAIVSRMANEKVGEGHTTSGEGHMLSQAEGTSASEDESSVYVSRVVRAVQHVSSTRWYAIGSACGKTFDQLQQLKSFPDDSDKVQALFDQLAQQMGRKRAADKLLEACNSMANPTYAAVREEMEK